MQKYRRFGVICSLMVCCVWACAQNTEVKRKQGEAQRAVGEAYMVEGNYREALKYLLDANQLYTKDPYLHNSIGLVYLAMKKPELAVDHFKSSLELRPDYAPAKNNLGTAYLESGNLEDAITCFKEVSENILYATPHYPMLNLGEAYFLKKEYTLARTYYQNVLDYYRDGHGKDATYVKALRGLGRVQLALGNQTEAVTLFQRAMVLAPGFELLYLDLAGVYQLAGEHEKALQTYERLIRLAPESLFAEDARKEANRLRKRMGNGATRLID